MTLWLLLIAFSVRECRSAPEKTEVEMVNSLRRQLMHENYDYMEGSDSDALTTTQAPLRAYDEPDMPEDYADAPPPGQRDYTSKDTTIDPELNALPESNSPSMTAPPQSRRALDADDDAEQLNFNKNYPLEQRSDKKDFLYYLDDNRLDDPLLHQINDVIADDAISTTTPRYKILKERDASGQVHSGRRNGGDSGRGQKRRMFLQEERDGYIAIVNLAGGPFPEFRLPRSRRQYMADDYDELKSIENEIFGSTTENTTTTATPPPTTRRDGMRRAPLPSSEEEQISITRRTKKSHSEEYGLKVSSAYHNLMNEKKHMREDLYNPKRDRFELDHPDIAMRDYYRTTPYDPLGEMHV